MGKAMLPICNIPMISYVLHTLVRARFDGTSNTEHQQCSLKIHPHFPEAFICANEEAIKEISVFLQDVALPIRIEFETLSHESLVACSFVPVLTRIVPAHATLCGSWATSLWYVHTLFYSHPH